jgi:methylmalonyl-CoA mutase cobalamin-binding subunit
VSATDMKEIYDILTSLEATAAELVAKRRPSPAELAPLDKATRIMELMQKEKMDDVLVLVGGIIPDADVRKLKELGVSEIFQPGASTEDIIAYVKGNVGKRGHSS